MCIYSFVTIGTIFLTVTYILFSSIFGVLVRLLGGRSTAAASRAAAPSYQTNWYNIRRLIVNIINGTSL